MSKGVFRAIPWLIVVLALVLVGCSGGGEAAPGADEPAAGGETDSERVEITMDSVKSGVEMKIGQQAVLKLDPGYNWSANVTPELVFSQVKDAPLAEGEQAVFEAKLAGSAVIQASGKAACAKDNPPCPTPPAQLMIKVKVTP